MKRTLLAMSLLLLLSSAAQAEPGWDGRVIMRGANRQAVQSTPILTRSYRPFHFYGNTVRRRHYRGNPLPMPRDMARGSFALVRGR